MKDYRTSHRDSLGFTARPMTQDEWDKYADAWHAAKLEPQERAQEPEQQEPEPMSPEEEETLF